MVVRGRQTAATDVQVRRTWSHSELYSQVVGRCDCLNTEVCFRAVSRTKSDLQLDVEKLTSLVFNRETLWESDSKRLSQSAFMQKNLDGDNTGTK